MKSFLAGSALILISNLAMANGTTRYSCYSGNTLSPIKKVTVSYFSKEDPMYRLNLTYQDGVVAVLKANYGDDMDNVYYVSEDENTVLSWEWSPMRDKNQAPGTLTLPHDGKAIAVQMRCFSVRD